MGAALFTIYQLNTELSFKDIIDIYNKDRDDKQGKYKIQPKSDDIRLKNIEDYSVYLLTRKTKPGWRLPLKKLVNNLPEIENTNFSFILFLKIGKYKFAATGGVAHHVISNYKTFNFGVDLLTRLINLDDAAIKRIENRPVTGNILSSSINYVGGIPIFFERDFNSFIRGAQIALDSTIIQDKLGIPINTRKRDFNFLAKDSIQLGKSITIHQLDAMLGNISSLLDTESVPINYFERINQEDARTKSLNEKMALKFNQYLEGNEDDLFLAVFYENYEKVLLNVENENSEVKNITDIKIVLQKYYNTSAESKTIADVLINSKIIFEDNDGGTFSTNFVDLIDTKVDLESQPYWLLEGNWYKLETDFIEQLNEEYKSKMKEFFDADFKLSEIKPWPILKKSETKYNFNHNKLDSVFVLDRIFYQNIELCDLMIVRKDENQIYFVHVKKGLNSSMRELASQLENAIRTFNESYNINEVISSYYRIILQKIKDEPNESMISKSARKFKEFFPNEQEFIHLVNNSEKIFVCAVRPKESNDILKPQTIDSSIAKISFLQIIELSKLVDTPIKILKIKH